MVGHCDPPVEHQFKEGNPGGPGKPKGSKNFATILEILLEKETEVEEEGRKLTRKELMAYNLIQMALAATKEESQLKATAEVIDRLEGKAKAVTENTNTNVDMTHDEWVKNVNDMAKDGGI